MTSYEQFICKQFKAGKLTQAQLDFLHTNHRIGDEAYACAQEPTCDCEWTTALAVAAEAPADS